MKRLQLLLPLLIIIPLLFACSSSDDNKEPTQDYTSFVFYNTDEGDPAPTLTNCVVGYYEDGLCKKIAELGDIGPAQTSKEIRVDNENIETLYFFSNYPYYVTKYLKEFVLQPNKKNRFVIDASIRGELVDPEDPTQYPH